MISARHLANEYLNQDSRVEAVSSLHDRLNDAFTELVQTRRLQWFDRGSDVAYLHHLLDQLGEEVSLLIIGLETDDPELALERSQEYDPAMKSFHRCRSMTSLAGRYSLLIETLRAAANAAASEKDWRLTDICSDFAHRFEESLWFLVVNLQENSCDDRSTSTSTGTRLP